MRQAVREHVDWREELAQPTVRVASVPVPEDYRFQARRKAPPAGQPPPRCAWDGPVTIACVLRPSADYQPADVNRLFRAVQRNLSRRFRCVCLTDVAQQEFDTGVEAVALAHPDWQTKHSKIELFRPDLLETWGRVIYIDLDTAVTGPLDDIATYDGGFAMLRDFYYSQMNGSGLMAWGPTGAGLTPLSEIYDDFRATPLSVRETAYRIGGGLGDQLFIRHHTPLAPHQLQDMFPGQIGSYKVHFRRRPPPATPPRLVCFHGRPKPNEIPDGWIRKAIYDS